jgi:hypothetical protein
VNLSQVQEAQEEEHRACQEGTRNILRKKKGQVPWKSKKICKLKRCSAKLHAKRKCAPGPRLNFIAKDQEEE